MKRMMTSLGNEAIFAAILLDGDWVKMTFEKQRDSGGQARGGAIWYVLYDQGGGGHEKRLWRGSERSGGGRSILQRALDTRGAEVAGFFLPCSRIRRTDTQEPARPRGRVLHS